MTFPKRGLPCGGFFLLAITAFLCLTFGLFAQFYGIDGPSALDGETRAAPIISALDEYKKDNGSYPTELDLLSPSYLSFVPRPSWRWPYAYEYELRKDEFILSLLQICDDWNCSEFISIWMCDSYVDLNLPAIQ